MHIKLPVLSGLVLGSALLFSSFNDKPFQPSSTADRNNGDTATGYLAKYGAYVYARENCSNCHVLKITENPAMVSLDGLGGKYPDKWHYHFLMTPDVVIPTSTMPAYPLLAENRMVKDMFLKNVPNVSEKEWNQLMDEALKMQTDFTSDQINIDPQSEILALIAYLNSIPESKALHSRRKKEEERIAAEHKKMDSLWNESESVILSAAADTGNISAGASLFLLNCSACHGTKGEGMIGPNLTDAYWLHGNAPLQMAATIKNGVLEKGMPPWKYIFTPAEVGQLVAYIQSIQNTRPKNAKMKQGKKV